ncbi:MAG: Ig-like domain-containing protein [Gemmatimonadota bacterium]|nr:Ig-like domain-containing protein [Gemmatimonadota bacterium]
MRSFGRTTAIVIAALVYAACHDGGTRVVVPVPTALTKISGDNQTGIVGAALANPFVVKVTDQSGQPMSGVSVQWTSTGGTFSAASGTTDASGLMSVGFTIAGGTADAKTAVASVTGLNSVTFNVATTAAAASQLVKVSGDAQTGTVGTSLAAPLVVKVADAFGNVVSGVPLAFTLTGTGALAPGTATTGANGQAQTALTFGNDAGGRTVTVSGAGLTSVTFAETATAAAAATVAKVSGDAQTGIAGRTLAAPFTVIVKDAFNNVVPNATVTWTATGGNGASIAATSTTNASGNASATLTLGTVIGAYGATASVAGVATPAIFTATATAGPPFTVTKIAGDAQTGMVGTVLATDLIVQVKDQFGNVVVGTAVTWAVSGGGSASASTTDATGQARTTVTLGTVSGAQTVTATASTASAVFTTTNTPGAAVAIVKARGDNQTVSVGTAPQPFVGRFVDQYGNGTSATGLGGFYAIIPPALGANISTFSFVPTASGEISFSITAPTSAGALIARMAIFATGVAPTALDFAVTVTAPFLSGVAPAATAPSSGPIMVRWPQ